MDGVAVVELGVWVVGPSVAAVLADWGADVVKIEGPDGDPGRAWTTERNPVFELDNRGKRSVTLDLANPRGRELALELVADADVFVTNLRPGALAARGLDHRTLTARFPRLVYASVTGYGLDGPDRDRAAFDGGAFWSRAGVTAAMTPPGTALPPAPGGAGDHVTALAAVAGIGAALYAREQTGRGQLVATSLLRAGIFTVGSDVNMALRLGRAFPPRARTEAANPLYNAYATRDGRWIFLLGLQPDRHWEPLLRACELGPLAHDPRFATRQARAEHAPELIAALGEAFAGRDLAEWQPRLDAEGVWWSPVQSPLDVVDDEQARAAGAFVDAPVAEGRGAMVSSPVDFGATPWAVRRRAPEAGEDTEAVLLERGRDWDALAVLRDEGAFG